MPEFYHVGITVRDLDRSVAFYRDVAGLTEDLAVRKMDQRIMDAANEPFGVLTDNPGAALKVAHLTSGPFMLQLIEYVSGGGMTLDLHHNHIGSPHFCFYVADVDAKYDELRRQGDVPITSDIVQLAPNMRSFYTEDPDGVPVEFLQRTDR